MEFEEVFSKIGGFGRYQILLIVLLSIPILFTPSLIFIQQLTSEDTEHYCKAWKGEKCDWSNLTTTECENLKKVLSIPGTLTDGNETEFEECVKYDTKNISLETAVFTKDRISSSREVIGCDDGWVFQNSIHPSSIIIDFELVCKKSHMVNVAQSVFFAGDFVGSIFAGTAADAIGRRRTLLTSSIVGTVVALSTSFSPNIWIYMILRFCMAFLLRGFSLAAFVLLSEMVAPSKRILIGNFLWVSWGLGYIIFPGLAKAVTDWRILCLLLSVPLATKIFTTLFFIPESPRWLLSKKKPETAAKVLKKIARINRKVVSDDYIDTLCMVDNSKHSDEAKGTLKDLFRSPIVLLISVNMCFNWFVQSFLYYGLSLSITALGIDPYISFIVSGALEIPAYLSCMFVAELLGRKGATFSTMLLAGVGCMATPFVPQGIWRFTIAMVGKFGITMSFSIVYTWAAELVPTSLRSTGLGLFSMTSRIGSVIAPLILILEETWFGLPFIIFGSVSILAALLCLLLPETKGKPLPTTIQDTEMFHRKIHKIPEPIEIDNPAWTSGLDETGHLDDIPSPLDVSND